MYLISNLFILKARVINNLPKKNLQLFFNPKSIAVVGASNDRNSVGYALMANIISGGYKGKIYPINPNYSQIANLPCYSTIAAIKNQVDLAIVAVPSTIVPKIILECGQKQVGGAVVISAGFKEIGAKGLDLYNEITGLSKKYQLPLLGPNCLGFMRPHISLNATFAKTAALPGKIAFISQSGALCSSVLDWAKKQNVGFSAFVSIGEMADIDFADLIDYFGSDPETKSILLYLESVTQGQNFITAAKQVSLSKPIIALKAGKSLKGAQAALSHTGSLAGDDKVFSSALKNAGILRVNTIEELFDSAQFLTMPKLPQGKKLAILTNAGGPGVIATDYLMENGGELADFTAETLNRLKQILPKNANLTNPVDLLGDADWQRYAESLKIIINDPNTDAILLILTPQRVTDADKIAMAVVKTMQVSHKPIFAAWMGEKAVDNGRIILENQQIPVYRIPENSIRCFMNLYKYFQIRKHLQNSVKLPVRKNTQAIEKNKPIIQKVLKENRLVLTEPEAKEFLKNYGLPIPAYQIVSSLDEAMLAAENIGFPVVLKIISPNLLHKSEIGGYKLNLTTKLEVKNAYQEMLESLKKNHPQIKIDSVFVEKMIVKRYELMCGIKADHIFGPVIVFGSGGVAVEVYNDINISLLPLDKYNLDNLIENTKIYPLLKGFREQPKVNLPLLKEMLLKISQIPFDFPEIDNLDINPLAMDKNGGFILDAKITLKPVDLTNTHQVFWGKSHG